MFFYFKGDKEKCLTGAVCFDKISVQVNCLTGWTMLKHIEMGLLNDYYGGLLTDYQQKVVRGYYDNDMSLNEIALELSVSRQAVFDTLKRAEEKLINFEAKLGLVRKISSLSSAIEQEMAAADDNSKKLLGKILEQIKEI